MKIKHTAVNQMNARTIAQESFLAQYSEYLRWLYMWSNPTRHWPNTRHVDELLPLTPTPSVPQRRRKARDRQRRNDNGNLFHGRCQQARRH